MTVALWSGQSLTPSGTPLTQRAVRRPIDEMAAVGGRQGQVALELAPPYLSEQEAIDAVLARVT